MFVVKQSQSYRWPVSVEIPVDGGKFEKHTFDAEFKRPPNSRIRELKRQIMDDETSDFEIAKEFLVGWAGVADEVGVETPFSEHARDSLLEVAQVAGAVVKAFFESVGGAKAKNL